jgi:hypothetical protein
MQNSGMFLQFFNFLNRKVSNEHIIIKKSSKKIKTYLDNRIVKNHSKVKIYFMK